MTVYNLCGQQTPSSLAFMLVVSKSVPLLQWWVPSRQALTTGRPFIMFSLCHSHLQDLGTAVSLPYEENCLSFGPRNLLGNCHTQLREKVEDTLATSG